MEENVKSTSEEDMTCMKKSPEKQTPKSNGIVENCKAPLETMSVNRNSKEYSKGRLVSQNSGKSKPLRRSMAVNFGSSGTEGDDMEQVSHPRSESQNERFKVPDTSGTTQQEESTLSKNPSKSDLKAFLVKTLKEKPKDRLPILKLERDFSNLISDSSNKGVLTYEGMSSYYRMLVHRVAAYFDLEHNLDSSEKCVVVSKTNCSKIPEQSFQLYCSREYSDEELTSLPKSILRRSNTASSDDTPVSSRPGSPNTASNRHQAFKDKKSKSLEEREDDYIKAKARIFNQGSLSSQSSGEEKEMLSPNSVNQGDAASKQQPWSPRQHDVLSLGMKKTQQSGGPSIQHNVQFQQPLYATGNPAFNQQMNLSQPTYVQYPVEYVYVDRPQEGYSQVAGSRLGQQDVYMMTYAGQPQPQQIHLTQPILQQQQQQSTARQSGNISSSLQSTDTNISSSVAPSPSSQRSQQDSQVQQHQQQQQQRLESQQYSDVASAGQTSYGTPDPSLQPIVYYQQGQIPIPQEIQSSTAQSTQVQDVTSQLSTLNVSSNPTDNADDSTVQTQNTVQYQQPQRQSTMQPLQQQQQQHDQRQYPQSVHLQPTVLSSYPLQQQQQQSQQPTSYIVVQQPPSGGQAFSRNVQPSYQVSPQGAVLGHMVQTPYGASFVQVDAASAIPRYPYNATATVLPQQRPSSPLVLSPTYGAPPPSPGPTPPIQNTPPPQQATSPPHMLQSQQVTAGGISLSPNGGSSPLALNSPNFQFSPGPHLGPIQPKSPQDAQAFQFLRQRDTAVPYHYQQSIHPGYGGLMQGPGVVPFNMAAVSQTQPRPFIAVMPVQHPGPSYPIARRPYGGQMFQGYRHVVAYHPAGIPIPNPLLPVFPPHRKSKSRKGHQRYNTSHGHGRKDKDHGNVLEAYDFSEEVSLADLDNLLSSLRELGAQISKININRTTQELPSTSDADSTPPLANTLPIVLVTFKSSEKAHHALKNFHHPKYKLRIYRKTIETMTCTPVVDVNEKDKEDLEECETSNESKKDSESSVELPVTADRSTTTSAAATISVSSSDNNNTLIDQNNKLDDKSGTLNTNAPLNTTKSNDGSISN